MSREELDKVAEQIRPFMVQVLAEKKIDMVYVMLTDILEESSKDVYKRQTEYIGLLLVSRQNQILHIWLRFCKIWFF